MAEDNLASLQIAITASLKDFSAKMGEFESILKGTEEETKKVSSSWTETATAMAAGQLAVEAATKAFEMLKHAVMEGFGAADEQAQSVIRLTADLGSGAEEIVKWSEAQEKKTRFTKADSESAASALTIHKLNREEIEKLLPVIEDYASKKGVSATATAEAFGRAIEYGTTRGLRPYGIEVEKSGSQQDIFNELVAAGQGKVKGMAEQMGSAGLGPMVIFQNSIKEIQETVGDELMPQLKDLADWLNGDGIVAIKGFVKGTEDLVHGIVEMVKTAATFQATTANYGIIDSWKFADTMAEIDDAQYARDKKKIDNLLLINKQKLFEYQTEQELDIVTHKNTDAVQKRFNTTNKLLMLLLVQKQNLKQKIFHQEKILGKELI